MSCFGYVCLASDATSLACLASEFIVLSPFSRDPIIGCFFVGIDFFGIHFLSESIFYQEVVDAIRVFCRGDASVGDYGGSRRQLHSNAFGSWRNMPSTWQ